MVQLQNKIFNIVVIIVVLLFLILFAVNAAYWNRIRNNIIETTPVTRDEANIQFWLNIVWIIVAVAIIIYAIVDIFYQRQTAVVATGTSPLSNHIVVAESCPIPKKEIVTQSCLQVRPEAVGQTCPITRPTGIASNATPLYMLPKNI